MRVNWLSYLIAAEVLLCKKKMYGVRKSVYGYKTGESFVISRKVFFFAYCK